MSGTKGNYKIYTNQPLWGTVLVASFESTKEADDCLKNLLKDKSRDKNRYWIESPESTK
jgi:hypothetical protein